VTVLTHSSVLTVVYDVSNADGWEAAVRHRAMWGKLYTLIDWLDDDTVVLTFRPAENQKRWAGWERVRREWIMRDLHKERNLA
jgi:hypothetical protein